MEDEIQPISSFVLQVKCHSLLTAGRQTYVFCRAWAQSSRFGVSGKSLEWKTR